MDDRKNLPDPESLIPHYRGTSLPTFTEKMLLNQLTGWKRLADTLQSASARHQIAQDGELARSEERRRGTTGAEEGGYYVCR